MRFERAISVLVLATGVTYGGVEAAENPAGQAKPEAAAGTPASPPPKFQQEVGTNPWVLAKPTPEHAILAGLSGKFTSKVHLYSGPYVRMLDTEGTAEGKPLMGGVFVQVTQSETRMKAQFDAITIFGFDEATRKYTAASIDDTSSAIVFYNGTYDAGKKQLVLSGRFSDQKSRVFSIVRKVITFVDATTWTLEEFVSHRVGDPETKVVTVTFKRP